MIELDEMWAWIYCKEKNLTEEIAKAHPDAGDVWLWVAVDADTKLVPAWFLGQRDYRTAKAFVDDLASRLASRVQITTDGHWPYVEAIENAFGQDVDYSILQKLYGAPQENETRYSPARRIGIKMREVTGNPDQNWTVRTKDAPLHSLDQRILSQTQEPRAAATALNYFAYNFIFQHSTHRLSPAQAAGVTDHLGDVNDLVGLWEFTRRKNKRRKKGVSRTGPSAIFCQGNNSVPFVYEISECLAKLPLDFQETMLKCRTWGGGATGSTRE